MLNFFRRHAPSKPRPHLADENSQWTKELRQQADQLTLGELVVDLHDVQTISSQQLGEIIKVHLKLRHRDRRLVLENVSAGLLEVFELTRVSRMVEIRVESENGVLV